ncbi:G-type lectin S-receptor-like serine/threonine-protein kinase At4g27290 [Syzygium oleosum]|uniref:G-type lectin S-receptor-like serine/threonine-protein kinase At4g27290 n=1 Tax=Syzygium oleosum TaxID=219896 RepID=UPI0024BB8118|nr:G-type lectin S-receptor-like serine/threonine-protein kinase At4g27290 [Syzygium oleosum]
MRIQAWKHLNFSSAFSLSPLSVFGLSTAVDTLSSGQSMKDGETLVSSGQSFELGFFSPGNSTNWYLGIWYKITPETVVWVANRDNPLTDSHGFLTFNHAGDLVLVNQSKIVVWSLNLSRVLKNPVAQLLDTGNLVLRENTSLNSDDYSWQSFDHPSDTLLPGMKLGWDLKIGLERHLTSWKSMDDPSPGDYTYRLNIHGLPQGELVSLGSSKKYRTGPWNGIQFSGATMSSNPVTKPVFFYGQNEIYFVFVYEARQSEFIPRVLTMNHSGSLQFYVASKRSYAWNIMYSVPNDPCDAYGTCGASGICRINRAPICNCLKGFIPKFPEEWDLLNWSSGCMRRVPINCSKEEAFLKLSKVKLPDLLEFWLNKNMSLKECEAECLKNCSCTAYANSDVRGGGSGCLLWFGSLIDIKEYEEDDYGQTLYIRLPKSELDFLHNSDKKKRMVIAVLMSANAALFLSAMVYFRRIWNCQIKRNGWKIKEEDVDLPLFDLATIVNATNGFSEDSPIGGGGFGPVYKGNLFTGQDIYTMILNFDGYMSPEYAFDGIFSVKSDVFSFGVLLLEIAWLLWSEDGAMELVDGCLYDLVEPQVERCIHVGLLCVQKFPNDRPAMSSVVAMLGNESASLPRPKQPGFFMERSSMDLSATLRHEELHTVNAVTEPLSLKLVIEREEPGKKLTEGFMALEKLIYSPFLFSVFVMFVLNFSIASDTISSSQSIKDGEKLVSSGQSFELGFFSPENSKYRYLGIWYKFSPEKVVWVANGNNPLTDTDGVLTFSEERNLVVVNPSRSVIWSSNSSRVLRNPVAQLLDSGNLVVSENTSSRSGEYSWQSFDYPTDTLLAGMRIGWSLKTGFEWHLTSWKSTIDPSSGDYTYGIKVNELPQFEVLKRGSTKTFRTGPWNGFYFTGSPVTERTIFRQMFVYDETDVYLKFESSRDDITTIITLNQSGLVQCLLRKKESSTWDVMISFPRDPCDNYGQCGANGICRSNKDPKCQCLQGFMPKSQEEWHVLNSTSGCIRKAQLICSQEEGFLKLSMLNLPDLIDFWVNKNMSLEECKMECLKNCSCNAYANSDVRGGGSGCLMWFGNLFDIRESEQVNNEHHIYIRLPASELDSIHSPVNKKILLTVTVASVICGLLIAGIALSVMRKSRIRRRGLQSQKEDIDLPLFDFSTIADATGHFSQTNMIGAGGFGSVYKGNLSTGQEIAVKRLSRSSRQGLEEFMNEVLLIAKLQHRNLVGLLGYCIEGEERMLIYEYMPNKSLDYFIFDDDRSFLLAWKSRFDIALGIARGLLYLHQDSKLQVIHRDLKASNILLDADLNPKISDFGLAKIFAGHEREARTKRIIGTYGYMSPEYAYDGKFSVKSDVFSLGVILLEIVSGKRNRGFCHPDHEHNLLGHAWLLWSAGRSLELLHESLCDSFIASQVERCIQVGLVCVQKCPGDRPTMCSVIFMLANEEAILPQPKQPGFFKERGPSSTEESSIREESYTRNIVTITMPEGR